MNNIIKIFNSQDELEVKQAFKELLIGQFQSDLDNNEYYLFNVDHIEEMVNEAVQEVVDDFKIELQKKMRKELENIDIGRILKSV